MWGWHIGTGELWKNGSKLPKSFDWGKPSGTSGSEFPNLIRCQLNIKTGAFDISCNDSEMHPVCIVNAKKLYPFGLLGPGQTWTNLQLLDAPADPSSLLLVSCAGLSDVNGYYAPVELDHLKGTMVSYAKVGAPEFVMLRWQKKAWMIINAGSKQDLLPTKGAAILYRCMPQAGVLMTWPPLDGWECGLAKGVRSSLVSKYAPCKSGNGCTEYGCIYAHTDGRIPEPAPSVRPAVTDFGQASRPLLRMQSDETVAQTQTEQRVFHTVGTCSELETKWTVPKVISAASIGPVDGAMGETSFTMNAGLGTTPLHSAIDIVAMAYGTEQIKSVQAKATTGEEDLTAEERRSTIAAYANITKPSPFATVSLEVPSTFANHLDRFALHCRIEIPDVDDVVPEVSQGGAAASSGGAKESNKAGVPKIGKIPTRPLKAPPTSKRGRPKAEVPSMPAPVVPAALPITPQMETVMEMGFEESQARIALGRNRNDVQRAIEYLLTHVGELVEDPVAATVVPPSSIVSGASADAMDEDVDPAQFDLVGLAPESPFRQCEGRYTMSTQLVNGSPVWLHESADRAFYKVSKTTWYLHRKAHSNTAKSGTDPYLTFSPTKPIENVLGICEGKWHYNDASALSSASRPASTTEEAVYVELVPVPPQLPRLIVEQDHSDPLKVRDDVSLDGHGARC
jgi:hypothetical protein